MPPNFWQHEIQFNHDLIEDNQPALPAAHQAFDLSCAEPKVNQWTIQIDR